MAKPRESWASETLGLMVFVLVIIVLATAYGAFVLTMGFWLRFDPKVFVMFRRPTPEEIRHGFLALSSAVTAAISAGILACWLIFRGVDYLRRRESR